MRSTTGWIIYRVGQSELTEQDYEINRLIEEAATCDIKLRVLAPAQFDLVITRDNPKSVLLDGEAVELPDFVLPRLGAGTSYFGLAVIRQFERLGVDVFNSSMAIETVKDKLYTYQILAQSDLPLARTMLAKFPVDTEVVGKRIGFPLVVKTISGSEGKGIFLCEEPRAFGDLVDLIGATQPSLNIILQEFVATSQGRDLRVFTIGGRAICAMLRESVDGSFKANISRGGKGENFPLDPKIEWLCTEVARLMGLDIAGIDLLFDGNGYKICEANSSPGFRGLEAACSVNMARQLLAYIMLRLGRSELYPELFDADEKGGRNDVADLKPDKNDFKA